MKFLCGVILGAVLTILGKVFIDLFGLYAMAILSGGFVLGVVVLFVVLVAMFGDMRLSF